MAKIYTKTGDRGETGLFGGPRVKKSHPRIAAYGSVDELNASLGQARSLNDHADLDRILARIQNDLFEVGALLATPQAGPAAGRLRPEDVAFLEETIDRFDRELPPLRDFILPGGSPLASVFHLARTVCRRAEREIVGLMESEPIAPEVVVYMNRLSDLLFVLARWANLKKGRTDIYWEKKR